MLAKAVIRKKQGNAQLFTFIFKVEKNIFFRSAAASEVKGAIHPLSHIKAHKELDD